MWKRSRSGRTTIIGDTLRLYRQSIHDSIDPITNQLYAKGIKIVSIHTLIPTLEDAFVKLTGVDAEVMRVDKPVKMGGGRGVQQGVTNLQGLRGVQLMTTMLPGCGAAYRHPSFLAIKR
jgi:hypothetical protein